MRSPESVKRDVVARLRLRGLRFPQFVRGLLHEGLDRFAANTASDFFAERSFFQLSLILAMQLSLQKKMERAIAMRHVPAMPLYLRLFRHGSHISVALTVSSVHSLHREQLLYAFRTLLPGIHEKPRSFYFWQHPELPYFFCYMELYSLRGAVLSCKELRRVETHLKDQLELISPLTPALFWPYNEEESYRQIQLLQREVVTIRDLPHVSLHFQEQTPAFLEFLVHLVRPKSSTLFGQPWERLADASCHFYRVRHAFEMAAFSMRVPTFLFDVRDSINLLYARRYVLKQLEKVLGPFRDYNGGLFEKQQQHFEVIRLQLGQTIPHFDLFAEKLFYALHPVELRLALSLEDAEALLMAFSRVMCGEAAEVSVGRASCIRVERSAPFPRYMMKPRGEASLVLGHFHYLARLAGISHAHEEKCGLEATEVQEWGEIPKAPTLLRLVFQEGAPLSLNPYYASADMRCRVVSKLLFEGLMRFNAQGELELATAASVEERGTCYTFRLRPSYWSNGERVSAHDFVLGFQLALRDPISHPEWLFTIRGGRQFHQTGEGALGVRALHADLLEIELEQPDPLFLKRLTEPIFFPLFGSMREPKWFNGPYLVREATSERLLLEKNPYFWREEKVCFERIEIRWESSAELILEQFLRGQIDWVGDPLTTLSRACVDQLQQRGLLQTRPVSRRFSLYFNTTHPFLASAKIRKGMSLAIDRSWIAHHLFCHSTPCAPFESDPVQARACFMQGLHELSEATAPPLVFSYSHQTNRTALALYLQQVWKEVLGLDVELCCLEWNDFRNRLEQGAFHVSGTLQDVEDSRLFWERFEGDNSWNFSRWRHEGYRHALQQGSFSQAEEIVREETPFTPLFVATHLYARAPRLEGYFFNEEGCVDLSHSWENFDQDKDIL